MDWMASPLMQRVECMRVRSFLWSFLLPLTVGALFACSRAPQQYSNEPPPEVDMQGISFNAESPASAFELHSPTSPEGGLLLGESLPETQDQIDERVRSSSKAPILYGVGAGNITLETTLDEAQTRLSKPEVGPLPESDYYTQYREGLVIYWRSDEPRTPEGLFVIPGYDGTLELPAPYGSVEVGSSLSEYFTTNFKESVNTDPKVQRFVREVYNHFEGQADTYDCLKEGECHITPKGNETLLRFPGLTLFVSNESRRAISYFRFSPKFDAGLLSSDLDILKGEVVTGEGEIFALGDRWQDIVKRAQPSERVQPAMYVRSFGYSYADLGVNVSRSRFERSYQTPSQAETLTAIGVGSDFDSHILVNGQYVLVTPKSNGSVELTLIGHDKAKETMKSSNPEQSLGPMLLATQMPQLIGRPDLVASLVRQVKLLMIDQVKAHVAPEGLEVLSFENGFYSHRSNRILDAGVYFYDKSKQVGRVIKHRFDERAGEMTFTISLLNSPFDQLIRTNDGKAYSIPQTNADHPRTLSGFRLGDIVYIRDFDYGRQQATMLYKVGKDEFETRVAYQRDKTLPLIYNVQSETRTSYQPADLIHLGDVSLGVNLLGHESIGANSYIKAEINYISSSALTGEITNICQLPEFSARVGQYDIEFQKALAKAVAEAAQKRQEALNAVQSTLVESENPNELDSEQAKYLKVPDCLYIPIEDPGRSGLKVEYFFPNQQFKIYFATGEPGDLNFSRQVLGVSIYKKPSGGGK